MEDKGAEGHSTQEIIKQTKTERRKTNKVCFILQPTVSGAMIQQRRPFTNILH
jgi:hypothetical protein